jgi:S-adenosylmethionine:tRNA-ribosyltransferase-isomerase (queuine synthetase)
MIVNCLGIYQNSNSQIDTTWNGVSDYIILEDKTKYENLIEKLLNQSPNSNLGDKVYLGKLSNIPRHRVKEYFENSTSKKTSRIEQANTIIFSREYLLNFKEDLKKLELKEFLFLEKTQILQDYIRRNSSEWAYKKIEPVFENNIPLLLITYYKNINLANSLVHNFKRVIDTTQIKTQYVETLYRDTYTKEILNYLDLVLENPSINILFDEDFLTDLNSNGIELDADYLSTLNSMFESKEQANINLALEMLSNVNIENNYFTIALLLNKYQDLFAWGSGLSMSQNKSFKSIEKFLKDKGINYQADWRVFNAALYKNSQNDPEKLEIIIHSVLENLNKYMKAGNGGGLNLISIKLAS